MKKKSVENLNKSFSIFYDALSVGWHLRRIMELEPDIVSKQELYDKFLGWLGRHNIKPK